MILTAEKLGWKVRGISILQNVSLDVEEGETLGLIGPNGSGKSTLLKLLAGILTPSSGDVSLQGQAMARMSRRQVGQTLAFVEQQNFRLLRQGAGDMDALFFSAGQRVP